MSITIATSIAPRNIEQQQLAIASWTILGFSVVSMNIPEESEMLSRYFPNVTFVPVKRSAKELVGKPTVFINDILNYLQNCGSKIVGIVNSDIHLKLSPGFQEFLVKEADNSMVFGNRVDMESLSSINGSIYTLGFDYFFLDKSLIECYPNDCFCLGIPWWDYWIVLMPILRGKAVKFLATPIAFHGHHKQNYNGAHYGDFGKQLLKHIDLQIYNIILPIKFYSQCPSPLTPALNIWSVVIVIFIIACSLEIEYTGEEVNGVRVLGGYGDYKWAIDPLRKQFDMNSDRSETFAIELLKDMPCYKLAYDFFFYLYKNNSFSIDANLNGTEVCYQAEKNIIEWLNYLFVNKKYKTAKILLENYLGEDRIMLELLNNLSIVLEQASKNNKLGESFFLEGDISEALNHFLKVIDSCADFSDAINNLGVVHFYLGDVEKAIEFFYKALSFDASHKYAMINCCEIIKSRA
ncbi:MAG: hypothetical protein HQL10_12470 [Nitrospirae bacterium]|nr:hypothetical protein [Nitrospirota bacterium]